jgi:hypothetical protein
MCIFFEKGYAQPLHRTDASHWCTYQIGSEPCSQLEMLVYWSSTFHTLPKHEISLIVFINLTIVGMYFVKFTVYFLWYFTERMVQSVYYKIETPSSTRWSNTLLIRCFDVDRSIIITNIPLTLLKLTGIYIWSPYCRLSIVWKYGPTFQSNLKPTLPPYMKFSKLKHNLSTWFTWISGRNFIDLRKPKKDSSRPW